mmetsp:Transcript_3575/g.3882  ORF Transcript_3575/g.3882 Transcript_3575/m.3882 type:complete len:175 (+) Transcript_3575:181-705(+)
MSSSGDSNKPDTTTSVERQETVEKSPKVETGLKSQIYTKFEEWNELIYDLGQKRENEIWNILYRKRQNKESLTVEESKYLTFYHQNYIGELIATAGSIPILMHTMQLRGVVRQRPFQRSEFWRINRRWAPVTGLLVLNMIYTTNNRYLFTHPLHDVLYAKYLYEINNFKSQNPK